jgi:hypothetical protein
LGRPTIATRGFAIGITPFTLKEYFIYYGTFFLLNQENTAEYLSIEKNYSARDFAANQALFMSHRLAFSTRETMRNMEKYGIIPCPKYDEQQEDYITALVNDVAAIPGVVADDQMSAVLLEAMQYYTYDIVRPQYYEIALKRKGTRDDESEKMLDMIFEHTFIDFSYMYNNLIGSELYYGITQKNYASWAESNYKKFQTNIDKIIETVKGFE